MSCISEAHYGKLEECYKRKILPKILSKLDGSCDNVTLEIQSPSNAFFISSIYFVTIILKNGKSFYTVMKKPTNNPVSKIQIHESELFHNEILFYKEIASVNDGFPRCFYTSENAIDLEKATIVIENIESIGYQVCPAPYNIPYNYIISSIRAIARFHAMGYAMKINESEKLSKIINNIQETRYFRGEWNEVLVNLTAIRPINYLRKMNYDADFCQKMEVHLENAYENIMLDAVKPCEPLAVLCHGDFTRNNVFYRQTVDTLDSMLIDFAMMRYASPAIDLSTFLYISCSTDDILKNFDKIFKTYHDTLIDTLKEKGFKELAAYSYEKLLADYQRRALYGYIIGIFFTPVQRNLVCIDPNKLSFSMIKHTAISITDAGGDELSKELADQLINLRKNGCLDHIIL